jgi:hypothetical protein
MRVVRPACPDRITDVIRGIFGFSPPTETASPVRDFGPLSLRAFVLRLCFLGLISTIYVSNFGIPTVNASNDIDRELTQRQQ